MQQNTLISAGLVFGPQDRARPRMAVEQEKLHEHFPQFSFFKLDGQLTIRGELKTNHDHRYMIRVHIPDGYPYRIPKICVVGQPLDYMAPHRYVDGSLCILDAGDWSSTYSLAYVVARTAIWLAKYEYWLAHRVWPGPSHRF